MKKIRTLCTMVLTILLGLQLSSCEEDEVILENLIGEWQSVSIQYDTLYDDPWSDWDDGFFTEATSDYVLVFRTDGRGHYGIISPYRKEPFSWSTEGHTLRILFDRSQRVYKFKIRQLEGRRLRISPDHGPIEQIRFEKVGGPILN